MYTPRNTIIQCSKESKGLVTQKKKKLNLHLKSIVVNTHVYVNV